MSSCTRTTRTPSLPYGHRRASAANPRPPLPAWATPPEAVDREGVMRLRSSDTAIRDDRVRLDSRYRNLVRHQGRDRLVPTLADFRPFGHPFHDDIFAILRALREVGDVWLSAVPGSGSSSGSGCTATSSASSQVHRRGKDELGANPSKGEIL